MEAIASIIDRVPAWVGIDVSALEINGSQYDRHVWKVAELQTKAQ